MEKIEIIKREKTAIEKYLREIQTTRKRRTHRPPQRETLHINEELAAQLPNIDRMFILNDIGRKTKRTPFDKTYYCTNCKNTFHDNDNKSYRSTVNCPHCYKTSFTEHPPERQERSTTRDYTLDDFIKEMFK